MAPLQPHPVGHPLTHPTRDPAAAGPTPAPLPEPRGAGVYVHVPFCRVRCPYCDFATRPDRPSERPRFVAGVAAEAAGRAPAGGLAPDGRPWGSLSFGGGTPSRLDAASFTQLAAALDGALAFAAGHERSLEANPEDLDGPRLDAWRAAGVTRLSIGAQSLFDDELHRLGRMHDARAVADGVARARAAGFATINLDLMYAFPGHGTGRWRATLERALALGTDHLSAYAFTPEPGTAAGDAVLAGRVRRPDGDAEADLFELAARLAEGHGFRHYEVSNFARPGHVTLHHVNYWRRGAYLGLGPGAVSFLGGVRTTAPRDLARWAADATALPPGGGAPAPAGWERDEADRHAAFEVVFLGLRLDAGMRFSDFPAAVGPAAAARWRAAGGRLAARGWLAATADGFRVPGGQRARTDAICLAWQEEAGGGAEGAAGGGWTDPVGAS